MSSEAEKKRTELVHFLFKQNSVAKSSKPERRKRMFLGLCSGVVAAILVMCLLPISRESALMLAIFNLFFAPLVFPMAGNLFRKVLVLLAGNALGCVWNVFLSFAVDSVVPRYGEFANTLYMILNSYLNLVWIVPYWSLSLTILSKPRRSESQ